MSEKAHKCKLKPAIAISLTAICVCGVLITIGIPPLRAAQPRVVLEMEELRSNIAVEVEETIIHYQKQSFWTESDFVAILENKKDFKNKVITRLSVK